MLFDNFINYAMDQAGITKYKLAKDLGVSQSTIANWMNGTSEPRERRRAEVLDLFGVDEYGLEEGFPEIFYKGNQKETPALKNESGIAEKTIEAAILFDRAAPWLQDQVLSLLRAAEYPREVPGDAPKG